MFGAPVSNGLTFTKILSGISKTLSVANQVIPLYKEAKPIISALKDINKESKTPVKSKTIKNNTIQNSNIKKENSNLITRKNMPNFFL